MPLDTQRDRASHKPPRLATTSVAALLTYILSVTLTSLGTLSALTAEAAEPLWGASVGPKLETALPPHALSGVLDSAAYEALSVTAPDADNALVRVGVAPVLTGEREQRLGEALTLALRAVVGAQPHTVALPQGDVASLWRTWSAQSQRHQLPLTLTRAVSLGRTMGARYLILSRLSAEGGSYLLETKTVSMKQLRVIHEGSQPISRAALKAFESQVFERETRLDALWRSAVLPGWGQLYQGRKAAAVAYAATASILAVGAIASSLEGLSARATYQDNNAAGVPYRDEANSAFKRANYLWAGLGAVWLTSMVDSFILGREQRSIQFSFDPNGSVGLSGEF